jgi:hypothetical protein
MIIFDLDGTLADCEHRRHFVDPEKALEKDMHLLKDDIGLYYVDADPAIKSYWKPDWKSFYEACDEDKPIIPTMELYSRLWKESDYYDDFCIWSGRCASVRKKTEKWLEKYDIRYSELKMRPIGDSTPDDELKERWLDEYLKLDPNKLEGTKYSRKDPIEFVFDDRPKVVRMWRHRGIFVFDCNQTGKEF